MGARIYDALIRSYFPSAPYSFLLLVTFKQQTEKADRTAGRAPAGTWPAG